MRSTKRQRRKGVWEVRVYLGRDPFTGKPRQLSKTVYGGAKAADQVLRGLLDNRPPARDDGLGATFGQLLNRWKNASGWISRRRHSARTARKSMG